MISGPTPCKLLLTGFDSYGGKKSNISEQIANHIDQEAIPGIATKVLRTSYYDSETQVKELIETLRPAILLLTGETSRTAALRIELKARNADSQTVADNDNIIGRSPIIRSAPDEYDSTLPIGEIRARLDELEIPNEYSEDAGAYVCNHVFYTARHFIASRRLPVLCGFMHIPSAEIVYSRTCASGKEWAYEGIRATAQLLLEISLRQ